MSPMRCVMWRFVELFVLEKVLENFIAARILNDVVFWGPAAWLFRGSSSHRDKRNTAIVGACEASGCRAHQAHIIGTTISTAATERSRPRHSVQSSYFRGETFVLQSSGRACAFIKPPRAQESGFQAAPTLVSTTFTTCPEVIVSIDSVHQRQIVHSWCRAVSPRSIFYAHRNSDPRQGQQAAGTTRCLGCRLFTVVVVLHATDVESRT